jgi:cysteine-rich repeat protein
MKSLFLPALLAGFALAACGSDDTASSLAAPGSGTTGIACKSGEQVHCACPSTTSEGVQICQSDGKGFGACLGCPGGSAGSGGAGNAGQAGGGQSQGGGGARAGASGNGNGSGNGGKAGSGNASGQGGSPAGGASGQAGQGQAGQAGQGGSGMAGQAGQGGSGMAGGPGCGDGVRQAPQEQCDGADLGGLSCAALFGADYSGPLSCEATCMLDTTGCTKTTPPACGDGKVNQAVEQCDGADFAGNSCAKALGMPGATGSLACDASCEVSTAGCQASVSCGDGKRDPATEKCDGADLGGATCQSALGTDKAIGTLGCTKTCFFDTTGCTVPAYCGDGIKNAADECDGNDFGADTCESKLGKGHAGKLSCSGDCQESTALCMAVPYCGDGQIDPGEKCDGAALGADATCDKLVGFMSTGTISCGPNCTYTTSQCTPPQLCGNGKIDAGEDCDVALPPGSSCATALGTPLAAGTLGCNTSCKFDTSACAIGAGCGDGKLDPGEECDDGNALDDGNGCGKTCKVYCLPDEQKLGTHCYREYATSASWDTAEATCTQDPNGHLVTITSQQEFDFVYNNVFDQNFLADTSPRWIGLNDKATEGAFQWVTGEPVVVTAWANGEPNNGGGNENCVEMKWANGAWDDQLCATTRLFVCEYEPIVKFP